MSAPFLDPASADAAHEAGEDYHDERDYPVTVAQVVDLAAARMYPEVVAVSREMLLGRLRDRAEGLGLDIETEAGLTWPEPTHHRWEEDLLVVCPLEDSTITRLYVEATYERDLG